MKISPEFLDRCAAETGFLPATLERVIRLGEIAGDIGRDPFLSSALALKGGTALNLGYGPPRRLSVDLDFNYIGALELQRAREDRHRVEASIERIARQGGYRVQRAREEHAGRKLYLEYRSAFGPPGRIQVDLNFLFRIPLVSVERRELWQPGGLDQPGLGFVGLEEILAGKLLALLARTAPRDVYDVANLSDGAAQTAVQPQFRALFLALSTTLDHAVNLYGRERLERVTPARFEQQVREMLTGPDTIDVEEMKSRAWSVVEPLVTLTPEEAEFVEAVNARGELKLDLLLPEGDELAARLAVHPALLWKLLNVRKHRQRTGSSD